MLLRQRFQTLLTTYATASTRRPLLTNSVVGGTVFFVGDGAIQAASGERDGGRLLVATAWNGLFAAPFFAVWFRQLDRMLPGTTLRAVATKVVVNTSFVTPPVNALYLTFSTVLEAAVHGRDVGAAVLLAKDRIRHNLFEIVGASAAFWVPLNALNFLVVPPALRPLPSIFGGVVWSAFLSFAGHRDVSPSPVD